MTATAAGIAALEQLEYAGEAGEREWPEPAEFAGDAFGPPVPLEALPKVLGDHAASVAASVKVPLDLVVAGELAATAAAAARRAEAAIGQTHCEPLPLWMMPTAGSGERKPPIVRETTFPLEEEEKRRAREEAPEIRLAAQKRAIAERRVKLLQEAAAKSKDPSVRENLASEAAKLLSEVAAVPAATQLLIGDCTPEKLVLTLAEQGGRIMMASEEAGTLIGIATGRYSEKGDARLDDLLLSYDGGQIRVARMSREAVHVERPALSILVTAQPAILERMAGSSDLRGRGFSARFAYVVPRSLVGERFYEDLPVDAKARQRYADALAEILRLPIKSPEETPRLQIAGGALEVWRTFADELERDQADGGPLSAVRDWASKHAGRVARIAGLFHLVESVDARRDPFATPISAEVVAAAWVIGDWLREHALAAFARMGGDPASILARRLLAWIRRTQKQSISLRDCYQNHRDVERREDFGAALAVLTDRAFLRPVPVDHPGRGRKPSPTWIVNPAAHSGISGNCGREDPS
jgi:hypothetical protein